jgi:Ca-activated chloride channel family protein
MSDVMSDETTPDRDELHDQLIDRALRELVGGEAPPDLSERILAAGVPVIAISTPAGDDVMHRNTSVGKSARFRWGSLAVAASLLAGSAYLLTPALQSARESARTTLKENNQNQNQMGAADKPASGAVTGLGSLVKGESLTDVERVGGGSQGVTTPLAASAAQAGQSPAKDEDAIRMLVTPHIIILGEEPPTSEEGRTLGVPVDSKSGGASAGQGESGQLYAVNPNNNIGRHDQINDAYAQPEESAEASELSADGAAPASSGPVIAPAITESLAKKNRRALGRAGLATQASASPGQRAPVERFMKYTEDFDVPVLEDSFGMSSGRGPALGGDQYARIVENPFRAISAATTDNRLSTFSIDVDTASYANVRQFLMDSGTLPPPDAVRIEELVNYFDYDYSAPTGDVPFAQNVEVAACPWAPEHRLVRIGIKGREMERRQRPKSNLVFLIDVSGSMDEPNKLPLLLEGMKMLTRELGENDRVAIVVYASQEGLALESTRGDKQQEILDALGRLSAGGSTAGGAGILLAYKTAEENFVKDGVNRVILCTDGDFNVGVTSPAELQRLAEEKAKNTGVFLTVLGFGRGNLNDAMMEAVADHGNGNYHYVDNQSEARKVLVEEMTGTLVTIAKDVKIQVEFNPAQVAGYRLIGYENRVLAAEDFNDDKKDAGEIGAGHTVTALYEIVPAGAKVDAAKVDELKYGGGASVEAGAAAGVHPNIDLDGLQPTPSDELLTLKIRYIEPDGDKSEKLEFPITDNLQPFTKASEDFQFAAAVASFGMLLRQSEFKGDASLAGVAEIAESASRNRDPHGYRKEFVEMVRRAHELSGQ